MLACKSSLSPTIITSPGYPNYYYKDLNQIDDKGVKALANACWPLTTLRMSRNYINAKAIRWLSTANFVLQHLDISNLSLKIDYSLA